MSNDPSYKDKLYTKRSAHRNIMQDFNDGVDSVKKRLTKWEREHQEGYISRQKTATLFNATKKTIQASLGMLFKSEITYQDLAPQFLEIEEDIDANDSDINSFMQDVTASALWDGLSYILVDLPKNDTPIESMQQQRDLGIRPYFVKINATQLINKRFTHINGTNQLTQCTIEENVIEYDGDFGEKEVFQYRVLFIGGGRVYRKINDNFIVVSEWMNGLSYIPLVPVYTNKVGFFDATPKYIDIAMLNLKHFNFQSQLDKTLFIAANPIPLLWGKNDEAGVNIGVDQAISWKNKGDGDFQWREFSGTSVDKLQSEIKNIEQRMAIIGLSMLTQTNKEKTATEKSIDSAQENGDLSSIASSIEWSLKTAYIYWCDMMGINPTGEFDVCDDFVNRAITPDQARVYLDMYNSGTITLDQLWIQLENGEFIDEMEDKELIKAQLEASNQSLAQ